MILGTNNLLIFTTKVVQKVDISKYNNILLKKS